MSLEIFVRNLRSMIAVSSQPEIQAFSTRRLQHSAAAEAGSEMVEKNRAFLSLRVHKKPRSSLDKLVLICGWFSASGFVVACAFT